MKLLTRREFVDAVFDRDKNKCVTCGYPGVDAHHLMERRLWPDGGYYLDNGVTLCSECHLLAEKTTLHCDDLRRNAGIIGRHLPPHLDATEEWDKWGNMIMKGGQRMPGELFYEEGVQRVLESIQYLFTRRVKYPRTHHFPWSPGATSDDKILQSLKAFEGQRVIMTEKMDGENTTLYRGYMHARSLTYEHHESRSRIRATHSYISDDIPDGMRVCGENLFAKHSIHYTHLRDYFLGFGVWKDGTCLSWDETQEWLTLLDINPVPVIYDGPWDASTLQDLHLSYLYRDHVQKSPDLVEGYVVRVAREFSLSEFRTCVGKFVRANHVQTDEHWKSQPIVPNRVAL